MVPSMAATSERKIMSNKKSRNFAKKLSDIIYVCPCCIAANEKAHPKNKYLIVVEIVDQQDLTDLLKILPTLKWRKRVYIAQTSDQNIINDPDRILERFRVIHTDLARWNEGEISFKELFLQGIPPDRIKDSLTAGVLAQCMANHLNDYHQEDLVA